MNIDVKYLEKRICPDIVQSVGNRDGRNFLVTTFRYPDNDLVLLYIAHDGKKAYATDGGMTLFKCLVNRIAMNESRRALVDSVCRRYGVTNFDSELRIEIQPRTVRQNCLSLCEAVTRISNLHFEAAVRERSKIHDEVYDLLRRGIAAPRKIESVWSHPTIDPDKDFPVDFHLNGYGEPRNIFFVGSPGKSTLVAAVVGFLKLNNASAPTMSIVDPELTLPTRHIHRLQRVSDEVRYGVKGYEREIIAFASGRAA